MKPHKISQKWLAMKNSLWHKICISLRSTTSIWNIFSIQGIFNTIQGKITYDSVQQ